MPYNVNRESGYAQRQNYMQINNTDVVAITGDEGNNNIPVGNRKYAQLVYRVNPETIVISGALSANVVSVGLNADGTVQLSGDQLKVFDQEAVDGINALNTVYSTIVRSSGDFKWVMKAKVGSGTSGDAIWQIKRVESDDDGNIDILWADGNTNYDNIASNYSSLTYTL